MSIKTSGEALEFLDSVIPDPRKGLPEDVFLFVSSVTPMVNVDLLVRDDAGRVLLAWRDDEFCDPGWHVPGGIVRFQESFANRIAKTAEREFGSRVTFNQQPLEFLEIVEPGQRARGHFITFVYDCRLPRDWSAESQTSTPGEVGYLEWHTAFPETMIPVHHFYRRYFKKTNSGS